jgi:hypothetical protein
MATCVCTNGCSHEDDKAPQWLALRDYPLPIARPTHKEDVIALKATEGYTFFNKTQAVKMRDGLTNTMHRLWPADEEVIDWRAKFNEEVRRSESLRKQLENIENSLSNSLMVIAFYEKQHLAKK